MTFLFINSGSLNDVVILNILCNNLLGVSNKEPLEIDIISSKKKVNSNLFLTKDLIRNHITLSLTKNTFNKLINIFSCKYDCIVKIGENFQSEIVYNLFFLKKKIRTPFRMPQLFKTSKIYQNDEVNRKCKILFNKLLEYQLPEELTPVIQINKQIYNKTFEVVNWYLKSSNKLSINSKRFCFLYVNNFNLSNKNILEWLENIIQILLEMNIEIVPIFENVEALYYDLAEEISLQKNRSIISNFIRNNDTNYLYLFMKFSRFIITNDESLKLASELEQKPCLYYSFQNDDTFSKQNVFQDVKNLIN